jgi:quercetin 2,3-dioxygenase
MSAGTGVTHSEYNPSQSEPVHLLQMWILPARRGSAPSYEQKRFAADDLRAGLRVIASRDGRNGSVTVHQDATLYATILEPARRIAHELSAGRRAWLQVARGAVTLNRTHPLRAGDGAAIVQESAIDVAATHSAEILLFDLAA